MEGLMPWFSWGGGEECLVGEGLVITLCKAA